MCWGWRRGLRRRLDRYLVPALTALVRHHAGFLGAPVPRDGALALGAPDGAMGWRVFLETAEEVVLPGLERAGLDARAAWREVQGQEGMGA